MVVNFNKASTKCVFYSVGFEISTEVELITVLYTYVQCSKTALQPLKSNLYLVCGILWVTDWFKTPIEYQRQLFKQKFHFSRRFNSCRIEINFYSLNKLLTSTLLVSFLRCWLNWKSSHRHPIFFLTSCPDIKAKIALLKLRKQCFTTAIFPPWISPAKGWKTRALDPSPRRLCNRWTLQIWYYFPQTLSRVIARQRLKKKNMARISHILFDRSGNTVFFECKGEHAHVLSV